MSKQEEIEEEYLTCYICYDVFTEPKTLACLHRFCERCLQGYLVGLPESALRKGFPCPVCREVNLSPDPRRPAADWASLMRTDFHLKNLIKALKAGSRKDGGRVKAAPHPTHPCQVHGDKELDLFCVDCSSSICHLCAGISHRGCSQVITLSEAAADRRATVQLQQRHLATRLDRMRQLRAQIDSSLEALAGQGRHVEAAIRQRSEALVAAVRRRETEQVEELNRRFHSLKGDVAQRLLSTDNKMTGCQQVLETVPRKLEKASDADVVQTVAVLLNDDPLQEEDQKMRNILMRLKTIRLEYHPSSTQTIDLGEISLNLTSSGDEPTTVTAPGTSAKGPSQRPPVPPRRARSLTLATMETSHVTRAPVKLRTIPGKFREDQHSPRLRDLLVLQTEKIVLATDWANQCVKAFHERRERDSRLCVGGKPWCLTRVTDNTVAVSLPVSTQICVIKVTPRLALLSSFFAQKRYSGLAALSSDTLVASGGSDPPCVDIINLGGEVLRSFSRDVTTGAELFAYPSYLCMMPDRRHFLVSDRRKAALFCLDTSGHVKFVFRPEGSLGLREPSGVRADSAGGVYLAESRGVVKVTAQGVLDRPLLRCQDGVEDPRGLTLDAEGLVYVTSGEEDIVVFKVS